MDVKKLLYLVVLHVVFCAVSIAYIAEHQRFKTRQFIKKLGHNPFYANIQHFFKFNPCVAFFCKKADFRNDFMLHFANNLYFCTFKAMIIWKRTAIL